MRILMIVSCAAAAAFVLGAGGAEAARSCEADGTDRKTM